MEDASAETRAGEHPPLMELEGLVKRYGGITALGGVSLTLRAGEVTALVGDNGAGKSTLMKCISGAHEPDEGIVRLDGRVVRFRGPSDARDCGIETVYQDLALAEDLSVAANLFLGREVTRNLGFVRVLDNKKMRIRAAEIFEEFGINVSSVRAHVRSLSGGQRQGVAIGRAIGWGSKLVVMDEPTAALGVRETARVEATIRAVRERGIAVVIVSHNLEQVFKVADWVYVLRRGRVVGEREVSQTDADEVVSMITGAKAAGDTNAP